MLFKRFLIIHLVVFLCLSVFAYATYSAASQKDGLLKVYFLDVGQGDAIFVEAPNGNQVLIDGGPGNQVLSELAKIMPFYDYDIDLIALSHPQEDHAAGLIEVLKKYDVANIIWAEGEYNSPIFKTWTEAVKEENANEIDAVAGKTIDLGSGVILTILFPANSTAGTFVKNPNDNSVIIMLEYKGNRFLFTGDAEAAVERKLIGVGMDLKADVLKVGHHGSNTSTTDGFLLAIKPQIAVIEVGAKNRYGHPRKEILDRLEKKGIKYYRTDTDGTVKIVSDGINFKVIK